MKSKNKINEKSNNIYELNYIMGLKDRNNVMRS